MSNGGISGFDENAAQPFLPVNRGEVPGFDWQGDVTNNQIAVLIADIKRTEKYKDLWDKPKTLDFIARWFFTHQRTFPSMAQVETYSATVKENFRFSSGAGGSGINRANSVRSLETEILNQSSRMGLSLEPEVISYLANVAFDLDYSADQLTNDIVNIMDWSKVGTGTLTSTMDAVKSLASSYLVSVSETTLRDYAQKVASNKATIDGIESFLKAQAKAANPWLAQYIDQGVSPIELLRSARDQISNSLGLDVNDVNFTDSRFMDMVTVGEGTETRLANSREIAKAIKQDDAWKSTDEATGQLAAVGRIIGGLFGKDFF